MEIRHDGQAREVTEHGMKECKILKVDNFEADRVFDYNLSQMIVTINAMLEKGWELTHTHYARYHALLTFIRDTKWRNLE